MTDKKKTVKKAKKVEEKAEETSKFPFTVKLYGQKIQMVDENETSYISADGCTYSKGHPDFK